MTVILELFHLTVINFSYKLAINTLVQATASVNNLKPGSSENHIRTLSSEPAFLIQTINLEVAMLHRLHRQFLID